MKRNTFLARRLRQLVREELARMDFEAFARRIVREELHGGPADQQRPNLKVVK